MDIGNTNGLKEKPLKVLKICKALSTKPHWFLVACFTDGVPFKFYRFLASHSQTNVLVTVSCLTLSSRSASSSIKLQFFNTLEENNQSYII